MKTALVLAFLAVANAAFYDHTHNVHHILTDRNVFPPTYMMESEGIEGLVDPYLKEKYMKPALIFFKGPDGKIISYYANQGIDKINGIPEVKTAFDGLYGAADKVAVHFSPEEALGWYKSVLPGHFFQPEQNLALGRFMQDMPITQNFVPMKFAKQGVLPMNNMFNIDDLPNFYKYPVALDMTKTLYDSSVVPTGHGYTGFPFVAAAPAPVVNPAIVPMMGSGVDSFFRSGLTPAYHLVKADFPFFTATPVTGLADSAALKSSNFFGSGIVPTSAGIVPGSAGIVPGSAGFFPLEKAACVGCMGSEYVPTFKSLGGHHLVKPVVPLAHSLFSNPTASYIPLTF